MDYLHKQSLLWETSNSKTIEIMANNFSDYSRAELILNNFIACSRLNYSIRKYIPKYITHIRTQITIIARAHENQHWGTEKTYSRIMQEYIWDGMCPPQTKLFQKHFTLVTQLCASMGQDLYKSKSCSRIALVSTTRLLQDLGK